MPCTDGGPSASEENAELRGHVNYLTDMLCRIMQILKNRGEVGICPSQAQVWWEQHKRIDAARLKAEEAERKEQATREAALAKLTPAERRALGLAKR